MSPRWKNSTQQALAEVYLEEWHKMMEPYWNGHIYQNFPSEDYENYLWNYFGPALPGLLRVKKKYDPGNFFKFPQMVPARKHAPIWPPLVEQALTKGICDD